MNEDEPVKCLSATSPDSYIKTGHQVEKKKKQKEKDRQVLKLSIKLSI